MASLHTALSSLGPTPYLDIPRDVESINTYLQSAFKSAQTIIDSVPLPPPEPSTSRARSSTTTSSPPNGIEISSSSARSDLLDPDNAPLQKEWGKPVKLNAKDNPLEMSVYKLGGKDGKGAWFARRSVHDGLGFKKWKLGLQREFPESLEVQGGPGEGNIRGIGGERRVEREHVEGVGTLEVYHLSAQFPGPTTPRDFVTLLLTSSAAVSENKDGTSAQSKSDCKKPEPRHFMVISRPCLHPDCPPREGFVRGQYESVEFIREISKKSAKSASTTDLSRSNQTSTFLEKEAILRNATNSSKDSNVIAAEKRPAPATNPDAVREGRLRSKTISFTASRGPSAKGERLDIPHDEDLEANPVEWIMVTRSDPGGSVPRFMVERGTPAGIVSDASKFLDWVCKKEFQDEETERLEKGFVKNVEKPNDSDLEAIQTNGHLAGLDGAADVPEAVNSQFEKDPTAGESSHRETPKSAGVMASITDLAISGIETYAPQAVIDEIEPLVHASAPGKDTPATNGVATSQDIAPTPSVSSASSVVSFASAEDHFDDNLSTKSSSSLTKSLALKEKMSPHERQLAKLNEQRRLLNEKLEKAKAKETKDKVELTAREEERVRKAEEKHAKEIAKHEEKYQKEVARLEAKRKKEETKELDRKKKAEEKDEKLRLIREKEGIIQQLDLVSKERDLLKEQVGALQKENTSLVVKLGKVEDGRELLKEVKAEIGEGNRSRSGSLRRARAGTPEKGREAMVLTREANENQDMQVMK